MDGFTEKKWYIYMSDHHEGPYSLADLQQKMILGEATSGSYVWAEGMADWAQMTEIPVFESLLRPEKVSMFQPNFALASGPTVQAELAPQTEAMPIYEAKVDSVAFSPSVATLEPVLEAHSPSVITDGLAHVPGVTTASPPPARAKSSSSLIFTLLFLILVLAGISAYSLGYFSLDPFFLKLTDAVPALSKWISPIPKLTDVSPEDYNALKLASQAVIENGPAYAVALSKEDVFFPTFYVSTNLPDGTHFQVLAEGVPDTLLNQVSFDAKVDVTIAKKIGKSAPLKFSEGKPIPRGEYKISLRGADSSTIAQPLAKKTYFLGGARDAVYTTRLKEFHERLMQKSKNELAEITQFAAVLETQLGQTSTKFRTFSGGKRITPALRKSWQAYDKQWNDLSHQLISSFDKWTPDTLANDYFYGSLYLLVQQAFKAVEKTHAVHHAFFTNSTSSVDRNAFEVKVGEAASFAQNAINTLKSKISEAEKIPPTPNGMPRRDGL